MSPSASSTSNPDFRVREVAYNETFVLLQRDD